MIFSSMSKSTQLLCDPSAGVSRTLFFNIERLAGPEVGLVTTDWSELRKLTLESYGGTGDILSRLRQHHLVGNLQ